MSALIALLVLQTPAGTPQAPPRGAGREAARITVKRGTDGRASRVRKKPVATTVEKLLAAARPGDLPPDTRSPKYDATRIAPLETTVWSVKARIVEIVLREDGDFYMVIEGANGGRTVAECPDPKLCAGSAFLKEITTARAALEAKFHPTKQVQKVNVPATLIGVGYFGFQGRPVPAGTGMGSAVPGAAPNGAAGATPPDRGNGARLMPLIGVKF